LLVSFRDRACGDGSPLDQDPANWRRAQVGILPGCETAVYSDAGCTAGSFRKTLESVRFAQLTAL
jgi:hypothetical protein